MKGFFSVPSLTGGKATLGVGMLLAVAYASNIAGLNQTALPGARRVQGFFSRS